MFVEQPLVLPGSDKCKEGSSWQSHKPLTTDQHPLTNSLRNRHFCVVLNRTDRHLAPGSKGTYCHLTHKCMATADRAVVVFVKEFQRDQRIDKSITVQFTINPNPKIWIITGTKTHLFPIDFKCPQCFKKKFWSKPINQSRIFNVLMFNVLMAPPPPSTQKYIGVMILH